ncbi:MAG: DUF937 domain-containing protein [Pseudomonadota bacterium]|uniref:DUF937 domain-containing protein n=1 Tax=Roseovarius TaxID=74030 RepID=UPI0022A84E4D|nr:DUF937 domain-containing protein [Roseovarius sp. EGI FJ00037]MCZ0814041.1 DUF937 domain-containing protein [Roseovarius sp. EGI FJ00037]
MSIMRLLEQAQGGQGLSQLASQFGLDETKAQALTGMLAPAIGQAAKKRAETGQAETVLGFMKGEDKAAFFDDASAAATPEGVAQGQSFLNSLMGDAAATEGLASAAAEKAGVDQGTVAQFLPALAAMAQGGLQKQMPDSSIDGMLGMIQGAGGSGGLMGMIGGLLGGKGGAASSGPDLSMLTGMLDADGDGSVMDDILGKFMK